MLQRIRSKSRVAHLHKIYLSHYFVTNNDDGIVRKNQKSNTSKTLEDFSTLSKLRLVSLVGFTTAAGYICANVPLDIQTFASVCVGTGLCAGSAGTWNQIFEKNQDGLMKRTLNRPLPSERISVQTAKTFGTSVGFIGTLLLLWGTNPVVAALGLGNIILYVGPYTFSKKYTELNTWIGSLVGAIPPVMGYAAATGGSILAVEPVVLSTLLFLWQFPHFFALSWMYRDDYARGGFQMVSCNDITGMRTASLIREYSFYLTALPILTSVMGYTSYMFAFEGTTANLYLLYRVYKFQEDRSNANARKIFLCSLWYLPVLLIGYIFHRKASDIEVIDNLVSFI
jgi:protoheme IX farnesyltransferase